MTIKTPQRTALKLALMAPLALSALAAASHARAESILLAQSTFVNGNVSTDNSFTVQSAGQVTVDLQSLDWPAPLQSLSFSANSANGLLSSWSGKGLESDVVTLDVSAGTYFTHVIASGGGPFDLGLYSMLVTFTPTPPVPLPASGWLLLTGLFVLGGLARVLREVDLTEVASA